MDLPTLYMMRDGMNAQINSLRAQLALIEEEIARQEAEQGGGTNTDQINMKPETAAAVNTATPEPPADPGTPDPATGDTTRLDPDAA